MTINPGLIWLDERSAHEAISDRRRSGAINEEEEQNLLKFATDGYFITHVDLSKDAADTIDRDVDRLWATRPSNIAVAYDCPPMRFRDADPARDRKPRYRIHELHTASEEALRLFLDPMLHRYASLILSHTAIATQSLYFEYGSQQALHRDSTVVPTPEFGRLVAAWIALEDISADSGPLQYVPGSHRFPFYDFGRNEYTYDPSRHTPDDVAAAVGFYNDELKKSGLPSHTFLAKRGDVFIWHSALMHGGAPVVDETRTRKSFAIHYSTRASQRTRECAVTEVVDGKRGESVFTTSEVIERNGAVGFANALDGKFLYRR